MLGKWTECLRGHRNREDYKAQNIRKQRRIDELEAENRRLKRQMAAIEDFCRRSLA